MHASPETQPTLVSAVHHLVADEMVHGQAMISRELALMLWNQGHGLPPPRLWGDSAPKRCTGYEGYLFMPGACPACRALREYGPRPAQTVKGLGPGSFTVRGTPAPGETEYRRVQ